MYLLARSIRARYIIKAGTSFWVSTIYLALSVSQNVVDAENATSTKLTGKIIAAEKAAFKAAKAKGYLLERGGPRGRAMD